MFNKVDLKLKLCIKMVTLSGLFVSLRSQAEDWDCWYSWNMVGILLEQDLSKWGQKSNGHR